MAARKAVWSRPCLMSKPALADRPAPISASSGPILEPDYTVWRFWEGPPLEAVDTIAAMVVAGEFPIDKALADRLPKLGLVACFTSGHDGVDLAWARSRRLQVSHAPGVNHEDVADHAMGLMLAAWRRIRDGDAQLRGGAWKPTEKTMTASLTGRRLGIVGLGAIGAAVARRAEAFGLHIAWWGPREKPDAPWPRRESLEALAGESDILIVACKATPETTGLISKEVIEALGPAGLLVNVSRGQVVDEDAVIAALKAGRLGHGGAGRLPEGADAARSLGGDAQHGADPAHRRRHRGGGAQDGGPAARKPAPLLCRRDAS